MIQAASCTGQEIPFYPNLPYLGIHAGPANNDLVPCQTSPSYRLAWQVLPGHRIAQPNTFSPDGKATYVTTQPPSGDARTLFAIDVASGRVIWSHAYPNVVGWYAVTNGGSATSPAISPEGRYVVVGDGSGTGRGRLLWADIESCPRTGECRWAQIIELTGSPILGSPAVLPGGEVIFWETGADKTRALARVNPQGHFIWETDLGGNLDWTSVATVSQNHAKFVPN